MGRAVGVRPGAVLSSCLTTPRVNVAWSMPRGAQRLAGRGGEACNGQHAAYDMRHATHDVQQTTCATARRIWWAWGEAYGFGSEKDWGPTEAMSKKNLFDSCLAALYVTRHCRHTTGTGGYTVRPRRRCVAAASGCGDSRHFLASRCPVPACLPAGSEGRVCMEQCGREGKGREG